MRLFVRHRSDYRFSEPQARLVQLLRLTPCDHGGQSIVDWQIGVDRDARLKPAQDGYGNRSTMLYIDGPVDRMTIETRGEALTEDRAGMVTGTIERLPPLYFLQSSAATRPDAAIAAFAAEVKAADTLSLAHALAEHIDEAIGKAPASLDADHAAAAVLAAGEGDAQGTAHLLIAAARALRIPARYVAGHLYRPDTVETHAAHGWAELHVEGYGWIAFDAYEGCCPTEHYLRVAIGLDHREAAPVSGLRIGGGEEALTVDVHVGPEPAPRD